MSADEITDIAGGDPAMAKVLRESLRHLATGAAGPALQEMANDVLDGRITLREAVRHDHYAAALTERLDAFTEWHDSLSPQERQATVLKVDNDLARMREEDG